MNVPIRASDERLESVLACRRGCAHEVSDARLALIYVPNFVAFAGPAASEGEPGGLIFVSGLIVCDRINKRCKESGGALLYATIITRAHHELEGHILQRQVRQIRRLINGVCCVLCRRRRRG